MSKNKTTLIVILFFLIGVSTYFTVAPYFKLSNVNLEKIDSDANLDSKDLIKAYLLNEHKSDEYFNGKIIEVVGKVNKINFINKRNTVILYGLHKKHGVICDIHPSQVYKLKSLKINQKIMVKGICKGFLNDVILLNCYIDTKINE